MMHLLFDLDGTLTDPYEGITRSIVHAMVELGRPSPPRSNLGWCIGPPLIESFATLLGPDHAHLAGDALTLYRERFGDVGLFENRVYAGIPEALDALEEMGHFLYVATSKPRVFAEPIIAHFGLRRFFKRIYGSELDGRRNDKKNLIAHILDRESITACDASMIGDREHDVIGARANGVPGFGVLWGYGSKVELLASGAQDCIGRPRDLAAVFNGM